MTPLTDHSVWCWGSNLVQQLGITGITATSVPTQCWGGNATGELGDGAVLADTMPHHAAIGCTP